MGEEEEFGIWGEDFEGFAGGFAGGLARRFARGCWGDRDGVVGWWWW